MDPAAAQKGKILRELIESGLKERKDFDKIGKEIQQYGYSKDHDFQYQDFRNDELFFKATVAKTAEYLETVGPTLYQTDPDRRVNTRKWATPQSAARNAVTQDLLNYTPGETDLATHSRKAVNDALTFGMGVLWVGYNPRKKITQSVWDSIENLVLDPDAKIMEELNWAARKRFKPKWWLSNKYPDAETEIAGIRPDSKQSASGASGSQMVTFFEVYMRIGLHNYNDGKSFDTVADDTGEESASPISDSPRKYIVTEDGVILSESSWEVPYFLDDAWPFEILTFRDRPDSIYAPSPLEPGLGFQRALNWIYTLYISKARFTTRTLLGIAKYNGEGLSQEAIKRALKGSQLEVIEFEINGEQMKLADLIQQFNFTTGVEEFEKFVSIIEGAFERATGLTEFVSIGQTDRQLRSAAEAQLKDRNSRTRFEDMAARVAVWASKVSRREAQAARFLMKSDDIGRILGQPAAQLWGELVPPMDIQTAELMDRVQQANIPPEMVQQFIAENIKQGVVYDDWVLETDFDIEAGSLRRKDISQQQDAADTFMNQSFPALMQAGAVIPAMQGMLAWAKINNMPQPFLDALNMAANPPPPPPMQPGAPVDRHLRVIRQDHRRLRIR